MSNLDEILRRALVELEKRPAPEQQPGPKRVGRPRKRPAAERIFGMTLRIPTSLRNRLRRAAEAETEYLGEIVSVHDIVLIALESELRRRGV